MRSHLPAAAWRELAVLLHHEFRGEQLDVFLSDSERSLGLDRPELPPRWGRAERVRRFVEGLQASPEPGRQLARLVDRLVQDRPRADLGGLPKYLVAVGTEATAVVAAAADDPLCVSHGPSTPPAEPSVFVSYANEDLLWVDRFLLARERIRPPAGAPLWLDRLRIQPGEPWELAIDRGLGSARVGLFFVSPHLLASRFVMSREARQLFERSAEGAVQLLWVLVSPCDWRGSPFFPIQAALTRRKNEGSGSLSSRRTTLGALTQLDQATAERALEELARVVEDCFEAS